MKNRYLLSRRFAQINADKFKYKEITNIILRSFHEVYKKAKEKY